MHRTILSVAIIIMMMMSTVAFALAPGLTDESLADGAIVSTGSGVHNITYHFDDSSDVVAEAPYDGIASTEYNPLYWAGSFNDLSKSPASPASDWTAPETSISSVVERVITLNLTFWNSATRADVATINLNLSGATILSVSDPEPQSESQMHGSFGIPIVTGNVASFTAQADDAVEVMSCIIKLTVRYSIEVSASKVFAGWSEDPHVAFDDSDVILPGDVVPTSVTDLYAVWANPDYFITNDLTTVSGGNAKAVTEPDSGVSENDIVAPTPSTTVVYPLTDADSLNSSKQIVYSDGRTGPNMYTTQYAFTQGISLGAATGLPAGSYRSDSAYSGTGDLRSINLKTTTLNLTGNAILDNVILNADRNGNNHGNGAALGIFACGNILIMGTGITSSAITDEDLLKDDQRRLLPQIYGGNPTGTITTACVSNKSIVSETLTGEINVDLGVCLIIHSGYYYNIIGGSFNGDVGTSVAPLSVYSVFKGGESTDTYCAGNASGGMIYGIETTSETPGKTALQGGAFAYVTGGVLRGDYWEEMTVYDGTVDEPPQWWKNFRIKESTILEGAGGDAKSPDNGVSGSTHIFLSDRASVYDVQAGARTASVSTTFAFLEISGSAHVKHIACGTVTDGVAVSQKYREDCSAVGGVLINTIGTPRVASVFGAGYDTFYKADYTSMESGEICININGGTFGSVYGAGYRGYVGVDDGSKDKVNIHLDINSGEIKGNVFGGGRGGVDKICHNNDGTNSWGVSHTDSTGKSYVHGDVEVNINGGIVRGSIYGGGESVPMLYEYKPAKSTTGAYHVDPGSYTSEPNVAQVVGTTTVNVSGGTIGGSVYGAGKGISMDQFIPDPGNPNIGTSKIDPSTGEYYYDSSNIVMVSDGTLKRLEWQNHPSHPAQPYSTYVLTGAISPDGAALDYSTYAQVTEGSAVNIYGGTISGSVYGGGAYGITKGDSAVKITGGSIGGDVFGGGFGEVDQTSVEGNASISMSDGSVSGNLYGGCSLGVCLGNCTVTITGGTVSGNAFGGGLGTAGVVSTKAKRYVYMSGGRIEGSVYGGSQTGDDAIDEDAISSETASDDSNAYIVISEGRIDGSVYGGGYKGRTTGSTHILIGYDEHINKAVNGDVTIGNSVYGGGDVGILTGDMKPFDDTMVFGSSHIDINGDNNTFHFTGTISNAGNSCLTKGSGDIVIRDSVLSGNIESIQRSDDVRIINCSLRFDGKVSGEGNNTRYSFYDIGKLHLIGGSTVYLYAPLQEVREYASCSSDYVGDDAPYTMSSSPLNRIYICDGTLFEIRSTVDDAPAYGSVRGYTILSIETVEDYYGAFALGSTGSEGGFVVESNGTYRIADITDFTSCRCWFISGVLQTSGSATLLYEDGVETIQDVQRILIPTLSPSTSIRYSGGYFTSSTGYTIGDVIGDHRLTVLVGEDDGTIDNELVFNSGAGRFVPNTSGSIYEVIPSNIRPEHPVLGIRVTGCNVDANAHLGCVTIYLQEVVPVEYEEGETVKTDYIIQNRIELKVDLYLEGSGSNIPDEGLSIETVGGSGSVAVILPSNLHDHSLYLKSVSTDVIVDSSVPGAGLFVSTVKNNGGNTGWNSPMRTVDATGGLSETTLMQTLTGAYNATLSFSVVGFNGDSCNAECVFELRDANGGSPSVFTITVSISKHGPVVVRYIDSKQSIDRNYSFEYGSRLSENDGPATGDSFVGWYEDPEFINPYNHNNKLTRDMTLYARYMRTVVFDNMNGTASTMYVDIGAGIKITQPADPTREGYIFQGWYKDLGYNEAWDFDTDVVDSDVTLYAKWLGVPVRVEFLYSLDDGATYSELTDGAGGYYLHPRFGDRYGDGIDAATDMLKAILLEEGSDYKFIRWQIDRMEVDSIGIYRDSTVAHTTGVDEQGRYITLYAQLAVDAINIRLMPNTELPVDISVPTDYMVFKKDGAYTFNSNNATRTGYRLDAWETREVDGVRITRSLSEPWILTDADVEKYKEGENIIKLYAVWTEIRYTVTIVDTTEGTIRAYYNGVPFEEAEFSYGQEISLFYTVADGYEFSKWHLNGEGVLADAGSLTTTLFVTGSCAVYAQVRDLQTFTFDVYLDGGLDDSPEVLELYLSRNGIDTYVKFVPISVGMESERYYTRYEATSKLGDFLVCAMGPDNRLYVVDEIIVTDSVYVGSTEVFSVTNSISDGSDPGVTVIGIPYYTVPEETITIILPDHYETVGAIIARYNDVNHEVSGNTITLPMILNTGVVLSGTLALEKHTITYDPEAGFTYWVGEEEKYSAEVTYGDPIGSPPVIKDAGGEVVDYESLASDYKLLGWYYDPLFADEVHPADAVEGDVTLYPYIVEKASLQYTVNVYQMGVDGLYPMAPTYALRPSAHAGEVTSYTPPSYIGFAIDAERSTPSEMYTDFTPAADTVIDLYYVRSSADASISFGEGVAIMDGWVIEGHVATKKVYYGEVIALPAAILEGHTHTGWSVDGNPYDESTYTVDVIDGSGALVFPSVFEATFQINTYTLTLITPYGSFSDSKTTLSLPAVFNQVISVVIGENEPTGSAEYTFNGWVLDGNPFDTSSTMPAGDLVLMAGWIITEKVLMFSGDANVSITAFSGMTNISTGQSIRYGAMIEMTIVFDPGYTLGTRTPSDLGTLTSTDLQHYRLTFSMPGTNTEIAITSLQWEFHIGFFVNGVDDPSLGRTVTRGSSLDLTEISPTRIGYTFGGKWYSDNECTHEVNLFEDITGDHTVYGTVTPNTYTIAFNANGGSGSMPSMPMTYDVAKALTANAFSRIGYAFGGWARSTSGAAEFEDGQSVINLTSVDEGTVTLYAVWVANTYTIAFNANSGTGSMASMAMVYDVSANLPSNLFTKTGYTFGGWARSTSGAAEFEDGQSVINLTSVDEGTVTLYAVWVANTYTIAFNANSGTGSMASMSMTYDVAKTLTANTFSRTGYTFNGWATVPEGSPVYADEGEVENLTSVQGGTVTLYAAWTPITYSIAFNANGGTGTMESIPSVSYDCEYALPVNEFTKDGSKFIGWALSNDGAPMHADGASVMNLASSSVTVALYASWIAEQNHSGTYDGSEHGATASGNRVTVYYSESEIDARDHGSRTEPFLYTDVCDRLVYYYAESEHVGISGVLSVTISPKNLTFPSASAASRGYNGSADVKSQITLNDLDGIIEADEGEVYVGDSWTAVMPTPDAGSSKIVIIQGLSLSGGRSANYTVSAPSITIAIDKIDYEMGGVSFTDASFTYDGASHHPVVSGVLPTGLDDIQIVVGYSGAATNVADGPVMVTATFSTESTNYNTPSDMTAKATIAQRHVTLTSEGASKIYDGQELTKHTEPTVGGDGFVTGQGVKSFTITGTITDYVEGGKDNTFDYFLKVGTDVRNYDIESVCGKLIIIRKDVTITGIGADDKYYDGTVAATVTGVATAVINGAVEGDDVSVSSGTASFSDKNAGIGKDVSFSGFGLSGAKACNYALQSQPASTTASICKRPVTITSNDGSKVYNGTSLTNHSVTITGEGFADGEGVECDYTGEITYYDEDGAPNTFTYSAADGTDLDNYEIEYRFGTLSIIQRPVTITGLTVQDKVYNRNTSATTSGPPVISNLIGSDKDYVEVIHGAATFSDKNVGENKTVTFSGYLISGSRAINYILTGEPASVTASITEKPLDINGIEVVKSRVYNGTDIADVTNPGTVTCIPGDDLRLITSVSAVFNTANVGATSITITGYALDGADSGNYILNAVPVITDGVSITRKDVTISGIGADDKYYDGIVVATVTGVATATINGAVEGDDVSVSSGKASFSDKNAGIGKDVSFSGFGLSGAKASNYSLSSQPAPVKATIFRLSIDITGNDVSKTKEYDGTDAATIIAHGTVTPVVETDDLALDYDGASASFDTPDAGTRTIAITGYGLKGADRDNYSLNPLPDITVDAFISKRAIALTSETGEMDYDGTALVCEGWWISSEKGLVDGHDIHVTVTGSQTSVGSSDNTFMVDWIRIGGESGADVAGNYEITPVYGRLTVVKAVVAWPEISSKEYTGSLQRADVPEGLYNVLLNLGGTDVGSYGVTLCLADSESYRWADVETAEKRVDDAFTIVKAVNVFITELSIDDWTYGGTPSVPHATSKFGSPSYTYSSTEEGPYVSDVPSNAGRYYVRATVSGTSNYFGLEAHVGFTIEKADYDMDGAEWVGGSFTYDRTEKSVSVTGLPEGVGIRSYTGNTAIAAGDYTASVTLTYDSTNYNEPVMDSFGWSIDRAVLDITGYAVEKERKYDGTDVASFTSYGIIAPLDGDEVDLITNGASARFNSADVGADRISISGYGLDGRDADNYRLNAIPDITDGVSITPRIVHIESDGATREYDGTPLEKHKVTVTGDGFVREDDVSYEYTGTITYYVEGGVENEFTYGLREGIVEDDYQITVGFGRLEITRKSVAVSASSTVRCYDGTADVRSQIVLGEIDGVIVEDSGKVSVAEGWGATIGSADAGTGKAVSFTGLGLSGEMASNYELATPSVTIDINPAELSLPSASATSRGYNGSTDVGPSVLLGSLSGVVGSDDVRVRGGWSASVASADAGEGKAVIFDGLALDGSARGNYILTAPSVTINISKIDYEMGGVSFTDASFTYDGDPHHPVVSGDLPTGLDGIRLEAAYSGSATDVADGAVTVTVSFSTSSTNYNVPSDMTAKATITPRDVIITSGTMSRTYNGTPLTDHTVTVTGGGFVGSDGAFYRFTGSITDFKEEGVQNRFEYVLNEGTDGRNYSIAVSYGTLKVLKASVTFEGISVASRAYDGTDSVKSQIALGDPSGIIRSDIGKVLVGDGWTATVDSMDAGDGKAVIFSGLELVGERSGNYELIIPSASIDILRRAVTFASDSDEKVYDGTALRNGTVSLTSGSLVPGEGFTFDVTGSITEYVDGGASNTFDYSPDAGTDAGNYDITKVEGTLTIIRKTLTVSATSSPRVYNGSVDVTSNIRLGDLSGVAGEDDVRLGAGWTASVDTAVVGAGKAVSFEGLGIEGAKAFNYLLTIPVVAIDITPIVVDDPAHISDFEYDGTVKVAVEPGEGYTVKNGSALNVGDYVAVVILDDKVNHVWRSTGASADLEFGYTIHAREFDVRFVSYKGTYDSFTHLAVSIFDDAGATISYSLDNETWTDSTPMVRNVSDSCTVYIKAVKTGFDDRFYEAEVTIGSTTLTIEAMSMIAEVINGVPAFDFTITGINGEGEPVKESMRSMMGAGYVPVIDERGRFVLLSADSPSSNYSRIMIGGDLKSIDLNRMAVDWNSTGYVAGEGLERIDLIVTDADGRDLSAVVEVTDSRHYESGEGFTGELAFIESPEDDDGLLAFSAHYLLLLLIPLALGLFVYHRRRSKR